MESSEGAQLVQDIIDRKSSISLEFGKGKIFRNSGEVRDLIGIITTSKNRWPDIMMIGLSGGRRSSGSYSYSIEKIAEELNMRVDDQRVTSFYHHIQSVIETIDPREEVDLSRFNIPESRDRKNYHHFIRDIDLVIVHSDQYKGIPQPFYGIHGEESGTDFDLFRPTAKTIVNRRYKNELSVINFFKSSKIRGL